jgi:hypothetical protein
MGMFGRKAESGPVIAPVDLATPVENPALVEQIKRGLESYAEAEMARTMQMLRDAVLLMATQTIHPDGGPAYTDQTLRAGSRMTIYAVQLADDRTALAVFTDWPALHAAVYPGGVVVNPFGPEVTLPVMPEAITWMYNVTRPRKTS